MAGLIENLNSFGIQLFSEHNTSHFPRSSSPILERGRVEGLAGQVLHLSLNYFFFETD